MFRFGCEVLCCDASSLTALALTGSAALLRGDDSARLLTIDHYVQREIDASRRSPVSRRSSTCASASSPAPPCGAAVSPDRVVLFVHGAGTPAEVAFDLPYQDYSWMAYLARAGFDVFSVDMTGYGRSTRPAPMNDLCNVPRDRQNEWIPTLLKAPCAPSYPQALTTIASDWDDVGAAVDYIRHLRRVERLSMVAWSLGGPRSGGYAARYPDKVKRLVLLAPAYARASAAAPPAKVPAEGAAFNTAVTRGSRGALEPPDRVCHAGRSCGSGCRLVRVAAIGSGRCDVGPGRPARADKRRRGAGTRRLSRRCRRRR